MNWVGGGDLNQARRAPQMVVLGNKVLALGGGGNATNALSTIEELEEDWTWSTSPLRMMKARSHFAAVVVPKEMLSP